LAHLGLSVRLSVRCSRQHATLSSIPISPSARFTAGRVASIEPPTTTSHINSAPYDPINRAPPQRPHPRHHRTRSRSAPIVVSFGTTATSPRAGALTTSLSPPSPASNHPRDRRTCLHVPRAPPQLARCHGRSHHNEPDHDGHDCHKRAGRFGTRHTRAALWCCPPHRVYHPLCGSQPRLPRTTTPSSPSSPSTTIRPAFARQGGKTTQNPSF
jgi:hypothetical protein